MELHFHKNKRIENYQKDALYGNKLDRSYGKNLSQVELPYYHKNTLKYMCTNKGEFKVRRCGNPLFTPKRDVDIKIAISL